MGSSPTIDPTRLAVIRECMESYDIGEANTDWPSNIISRRAVAYHDGTIAVADSLIVHDINDAELALCQRLAAEAAELMAGVSVGMGSEADTAFEAFFITAPLGAESPRSIDQGLIRDRFGGTLFPPATITVEPFAEDTVWWGEVAQDGADSTPSYFDPWRAMTTWFGQQLEFKDTAFVRVGDYAELFRLPKEAYPEGTVMPGCNLPRLALGLTHAGSLSGLFGYVVQT